MHTVPVQRILDLTEKLSSHELPDLSDAITALIAKRLNRWRAYPFMVVPPFTPGQIDPEIKEFLVSIFDKRQRSPSVKKILPPTPIHPAVVELINAWWEAFPETPLTIVELMIGAESLEKQSDLRLKKALLSCEPTLSGVKIGQLLRRTKDVQIGDIVLRNVGIRRLKTEWIVTKFAPQP